MQLSGLLEDESAVTVRLALSALKLCFTSLSHSHHSSLAMKLLFAIMQLKHNSYWLVKVHSVNPYTAKYSVASRPQDANYFFLQILR